MFSNQSTHYNTGHINHISPSLHQVFWAVFVPEVWKPVFLIGAKCSEISENIILESLISRVRWPPTLWGHKIPGPQEADFNFPLISVSIYSLACLAGYVVLTHLCWRLFTKTVRVTLAEGAGVLVLFAGTERPRGDNTGDRLVARDWGGASRPGYTVELVGEGGGGRLVVVEGAAGRWGRGGARVLYDDEHAARAVHILVVLLLASWLQLPTPLHTHTRTHKTKPATHKTKPATHKTKPATHKTKPATHKTKPATHKTKPATHKTKPATHKTKPATHKTKPATHKTKPATHKTKHTKPNLQHTQAVTVIRYKGLTSSTNLRYSSNMVLKMPKLLYWYCFCQLFKWASFRCQHFKAVTDKIVNILKNTWKFWIYCLPFYDGFL